jgi:serine/threonine protein kinase
METPKEAPYGILSEKYINWFDPNKGQVLGEGTFGIVKRYGDKVVKMSKRVKYGTDASLLRESAFLAKLNHPNIIKLLDVFILNTYSNNININIFCIVLPEAKMDLLKRRRQIPGLHEEDVKLISYQIIRGIEYLHSQDILHGDIKPQNILLFEDLSPDWDHKPCLRAVIADFGIAQPNQCRETLERVEVFTIWYRAPELFLGARYSASADIWALGCVIHEIFTDYTLFPGMFDFEVLSLQFSLLGVPNEQTWPGVSLLPYYDKKFKIILHNSKRLQTNDKKFNTFISKLLVLDPSKRALTIELLQDSWFDNIKDKINSECLKVSETKSINCNVSILNNIIPTISPNHYPLDIIKKRNLLFFMFKLREDFGFVDSFIYYITYLFDLIYSRISVDDRYNLNKEDPADILTACTHISSQILNYQLENGTLTEFKSIYTEKELKVKLPSPSSQGNAKCISPIVIKIIELLKIDLYFSSLYDILQIFVIPETKDLSITFLNILLFTSLIYRYKADNIVYFCLKLTCDYLKIEFQYTNKLNNYKELLGIIKEDLERNEIKNQSLSKLNRGIFKARNMVNYIFFL